MNISLIVLGLIGAACAVPRQSRIIGGEDTNIESYPFMAGILTRWYEDVFSLECGGSLISTVSVVSAAHCFDNYTVSDVRVRLGTDNDTYGGVEHIVSRLVIHPQYDSFWFTNDICVIRLRDPAVYSNKINGARIAGPNYHLPTDTIVYAAGWGYIQVGGPASQMLKHVAINIIDHQICTERYAYLKTLPDMSEMPDVTPEMLCTGILDVGGKDGCQGDSGGPVVHNRDVLVGISSWGYECAHPMYPGVNVRVSSYTNWIYTNSIN